MGSANGTRKLDWTIQQMKSVPFSARCDGKHLLSNLHELLIFFHSNLALVVQIFFYILVDFSFIGYIAIAKLSSFNNSCNWRQLPKPNLTYLEAEGIKMFQNEHTKWSAHGSMPHFICCFKLTDIPSFLHYTNLKFDNKCISAHRVAIVLT